MRSPSPRSSSEPWLEPSTPKYSSGSWSTLVSPVPSGCQRESADHGSSAPSAARGAIALLVAGVGLLNVAEAGWAHAGGVVCLLGAVVVGFLAVVPAWLVSEGG